MPTINPYLNFLGNAEEAFNFYKSVFGGEFISLQRYKDMPQGEDGCQETSKADQEKILHVALPIGKENVLMASDCMESMKGTMIVGNNITISINTNSEAETERLFNLLSTDGKIIMPLQKMFWNAYFGMFTDKFGIQWMVNYDYNQNK
jgi:PhnB protein